MNEYKTNIMQIKKYDKVDKYEKGTAALFYCMEPQRFNYPSIDPYRAPPLVKPLPPLIKPLPPLISDPVITPRIPNRYPYIGKDW